MGYAAALAVGMQVSMAGGADFVWLLDNDSVPLSQALERVSRVRRRCERMALRRRGAWDGARGVTGRTVERR